MAKNSGLGKGLKALISEDFTMEAGGGDPAKQGQQLVFEVALSRIRPNKEQPRQSFSKSALDELAASISEHGILQPLVVRPEGKGYTIIAGERRFRAARIAGLKEVPVIVKDMEPREVMEIALIENVQRENLNPIEEAMAYGKLVEEYNLTQGEIGIRIGKNRATIANTMRLLQLPEAVRKQVMEDKLSAGHARALLALEDPKQMIDLAAQAEAESLNVREVEKRVKALKNPPKPDKPASEGDGRDPYLRDVEDQLKTRFSTGVRIKGSAQKGRIELDYYSMEELNSLLASLNITGRDYEARELSE
jgi:ParB family chromosome partitioning protein